MRTKPSKKLLKVHIYYTTNKILIQGRACRDWVNQEFERLRTIVHTLTRAEPSTQCSPVPDNAALSVVSTSQACVQSQGDASSTLALPQDTATTQQTAEPVPTLPSASPALLSPSLSLPAPDSDTAQSCVLSSSLQQPAVPNSCNIPTSHTLSPFPTLPDHGDFIEQPPITDGSSTPTSHTSSSLPILPDTKDSLEQAPVTDGSGAPEDSSSDSPVTDNDNSVADTPTDCSSCHSDCVPMADFLRTTQSLQAEISALRSALQEARQSFKIDLDALITKVNHQSVSKNKPHTPYTSDGSQKNSRKQSSPNPSKPPPPPPSCASSPQNPPPSNTTNRKQSSPSHRIPVRTTTPPLPQNPLHDAAVAKETSNVLLGDSTVQGIDLSRSTPPHSQPQNVCVSGLTVSDLTEWLTQQTPTPKVNQATFHVGITDCCELSSNKEASSITVQQWRALITQCQRVFPKAQIQASSILPARGRNPLNTIIRPSNDRLQEACNNLRVKYIDHCSTFTTPSGAPRMALYGNAIRPSKTGIARLAQSLFPLRRPPLLPTPPPSHPTKSAGVLYQSRNKSTVSNGPSVLPPLFNQSDFPGLPSRSCPQSKSPPSTLTPSQFPPPRKPAPPPQAPLLRNSAVLNARTAESRFYGIASPVSRPAEIHRSDPRLHITPCESDPPPPVPCAERDEVQSAPWPYSPVYRPFAPLPPPSLLQHYLRFPSNQSHLWYNWPFFMPPPSPPPSYM